MGPTLTTPDQDPEEASLPPETTDPDDAPSAPTRVSVPAIGVVEPLMPLGLNADGTMQVPETGIEIGWFEHGSRPGQAGPTVIAAHVDDLREEGAFARLTEVSAGDEVQLYGSDGEVARYRITDTIDYPKSTFPTEVVFGATSTDEIRLITCTGRWDVDAQSYEDNRVVFGERLPDS